ncbi:MAG: hypothetical protein SGI99_04180, partial [Pseudomonadota bacterium]|nr:hypothetical protein [Pseudomonadota bacterium]
MNRRLSVIKRLELRIARVTTLAVMLALGNVAWAGTDPLAPLGANIGGISDFSDEFPFVDLMKSARDWIPG